MAQAKKARLTASAIPIREVRMLHSNVRFILTAVFLGTPSLAVAQDFTDFCPDGNEETDAAVVGYVTDPDLNTVVPGVSVAASWVQDGARRRIVADANLEGLFTLCGLPQESEVSLRASFGDRRGSAVPYTTSAILAQQDLYLSLAADNEEEVNDEVGSLAGGGSGRAYSADVIRAEDLVYLPEMSVYQLLRQHQRIRFDRFTGMGEVILFDHVVSTSLNNGRFTAVQVLVNERPQGDGVSVVRGMSIDEVKRIDILSRSEASARYGGDGWIGAIVITTKDR